MLWGFIDDGERTTALVVLGADREGRYAVDPNALASLLIGLGDVVCLPAGVGDAGRRRHLTRPFAPAGKAIVIVQAADVGNRFRRGDVVRLGEQALSGHDGSPDALAQHVAAHVIDRQNARIEDGGMQPESIRSKILGRLHERRLRERAESTAAPLEVQLTEQRATNELLRTEIERLGNKVRALHRSRSAPVAAPPADAALRGALRTILDRDRDAPALTIHELLVVLARAWPERVEVLPRAFKSARSGEARNFAYPDKVRRLLHLLVTGYWSAWTDGHGDETAKAVFGANTFAPRESGKLSDKGRRRRERTHGDRTYAMERHLKIGNADGAGSFRLHFDWDERAKRILIGHCGPHLAF